MPGTYYALKMSHKIHFEGISVMCTIIFLKIKELRHIRR